MKILHIFNHSAPRYTGYTFRSLGLVGAQRRRGWKTLHLTSSKQGPCLELADTVDGLRFHRTPPANRILASLPLLHQADVILGLRRRLASLLREHDVDLVHAHSPALTGLAALPVCRERGVPLVYEVRALWEDAKVDQGATREGSPRYRAMRALETRVAKGCQGLVTICEGLKQEMTERGIAPGKIQVVPNGVEVERFAQAGETAPPAIGEWVGKSEGPLLAFFGTFFNYEGLEVAVRAMPDLLRRFPGLRMLLVGEGESFAALKKLRGELGLEERILLPGRVPQEKIVACYKLADAMVFPRTSRRITELVTPLKPLEAMAAGVPVIASDIGGHRELIREGETGLLHRPEDVAHFIEVSAGLLEKRDLAESLVRNGLEEVRLNRTWDRIVERQVPLYRSLVGDTCS